MLALLTPQLSIQHDYDQVVYWMLSFLEEIHNRNRRPKIQGGAAVPVFLTGTVLVVREGIVALPTSATWVADGRTLDFGQPCFCSVIASVCFRYRLCRLYGIINFELSS